ncbi:uncharacterized protein F5891DRAFT_1031876 [Suillus fuscotomentosus]|uniref:Uncharacterized protein n=1 Tax=Suillus fuscotomentosus TaxID=1912939 RepID=A0AAD4E6Y9_9AGAM|nr:uncharacterized protein F5891DRAFT_1031876 [Suillus fuscotomentosus]KAG1900786.1 hypothetical protein F5891DRAFT_1031876 [Suillus fuscotomentosus]
MMSCSVIGVFEFWMSSLKFLLSFVSTIRVLIRPYCCHLCIASVLFPIAMGYLPSRLQAQSSLLSIVFLLLSAQSGVCFLPSFFCQDSSLRSGSSAYRPILRLSFVHQHIVPRAVTNHDRVSSHTPGPAPAPIADGR